MNQLVHIIKRCQILLKRHRALSWGLPVAIVALVLAPSIGFRPSLHIVQAQDGGTGQPLESYVALEVIPPSAPFCLGSTKALQATVRQVVAGSDVLLGSATIQYAFSDSILEDVTITPDTFVQGAILREQTFNFKGRAIGSGSIDIIASVSTSMLIGDGDELALPISNRPITLQASVPVEVIPCDYDLTIGLSWVTQMGNAQVIVSYGLPRTRIRFNRETNGMLPVGTLFNMSSSANRILGCRGVSVQNWALPQNLNGQRLDDGHIRLELAIYPQSATTLFSCDRGELNRRARSCKDYPDGRCDPDMRPDDFWRVEILRVDLAADGQSFVVPLQMTHARGQASGVATFILTPVTQ